MSTIPGENSEETPVEGETPQAEPTSPTEPSSLDESAEVAATPADPVTFTEPAEVPAAESPVAEPVEAPIAETPIAETPAAETPSYTPPPAPPAPPAVSSVAATAPETPTASGPAHAEPAPLIEPPTPDEAAAIDEAIAQSAAFAEPTPVVEPAVAEPATVAEPVEAAQYEAPEPVVVAPVAPVQPVYVEAPQPPRKKGNRGVGILWVLLGTIVFAGLLALALFIVLNYFYTGSLTIVALLSSSAFIVPVAVFFVAFVIAVLLINRAGWWAWVLGSLLVAAAVYFGSIGGILLFENVVAMTQSEAGEKFASLAVSAPIILATVLGREVAMWFGAAIASRGRRVKARNADARAAYEQKLATSRAI